MFEKHSSLAALVSPQQGNIHHRLALMEDFSGKAKSSDGSA